MSMTGIALLMLCLIHGLPVPIYLLFNGPDTFIFEVALSNVDRATTMAQLPIALTAMFFSLVLGIEIARFLLGGLPRHPSLIRERHIFSKRMGRVVHIDGTGKIILLIITLGMGLVSVIDNQIGKTWSYFSSGESELGKILLRVEEGGTPYYLYNVTLSAIAPFLVMITFCAARNSRRDTLLAPLALCLFLLVLLGKFGTLSKAPPIIFLLQLLLLFLLLRRTISNVTSVIQLGVSAFFLFGMIVSATIPDLDLQSVFFFLYYRIFDIPNESLIEYFAAIPSSLSHTHGGGIFTFLRENGKNDYIPMMSAVAELSRGNQISTSNALFIGDAWAEFGWLGVFGFSFMAGFIIRAYDRYAFRKGNTDEAACLVAGGAYGIFTLLATALNTALVTGGLLIIPVLAYALIKAPPKRRTHAYGPELTPRPTD